mmetsp:Transcript_155709/g.275068  ORF Transcript_155709/g.275068 Transcript_155709/m.275068 type:complete len:459 (+) Transcript_155709:89-1465(+)
MAEMQILKVEFKGELRRLRVSLPKEASAGETFQTIQEAIKNGFGWNHDSEITLKYKDEEADLCVLVEETVEDFLAQFAKGSLRLYASMVNPGFQVSVVRPGLKSKARAGELEKVVVIGSGNWGSTAARIVAQNTMKHDDFDDEVNMWVYEEMVDGRKLSEIINEKHENVKYLPGIYLGKNVKAVPDLSRAVEGASMLVFVTPHQFIKGLCPQIKGSMRPGARAISLIKGMDVTVDGFQLISGLIKQELGIDCSALMGANIAMEIAMEKFSEATVGYTKGKKKSGELWQRAFHTSYFHVTAVPDVAGCELCGTLKNIVAIGAGFTDGLGYGSNTKAAIMRIGLAEMRKLAQECFSTVQSETFFESCGVADVITTCLSGRNRACAMKFAENIIAGTPKTWEELEAELLKGQKLQGVLTSHEVQAVLERRGIVDKFPLFTTINRICTGEVRPEEIVNYLEA